MTYVFGRVHKLGSILWHQDEKTGRYYGNPSVSQKVASYMVSLRNRKARAGEAPTSARAITTVRASSCFFIHDFNVAQLVLLAFRMFSENYMTSTIIQRIKNPPLRKQKVSVACMTGEVQRVAVNYRQYTLLLFSACYAPMRF